MRLHSFLFAILSFGSILAQDKYVTIDEQHHKPTKELKEKIINAKYEPSSIFVNDYLTIKRNDQSTFTDSSGNILDKLYDFKTEMSTSHIFFTGDIVTGINDYGKKENDKYINIHAVDASGNKIDSEINSKSDYYFSSNMSRVYKHYFSKDQDYFTIHYNKPDPSKGWGYDLQEGLMNGKGEIIIEPKYKSVKQIENDFFIVTDGDNSKKVINLKDMSSIPANFSDIFSFNDVPNAQRLDPYLSFNEKIIAEDANSKAWGIYNLNTKSWEVPAIYQQLIPVNTFRQVDDKMRHILFTDTFIAVKDNQWGLINNTNNTIIPFEYEKVEYNNKYFKVFNKEGKMNYFDTASKTLLFNTFYDDIHYNVDEPSLAVLNLNQNVGLFDFDNKVFFVDPSEGFKGYEYVNKYKLILLKRKNAEGRSDRALFSIENKKIIYKDFNDFYYADRNGKFSKILHFDGTSSIIDNNGKVIVPPGNYYGRPQYQQGVFFYYNSSSKRAKAVHCYKNNGEPIDAATCAEKFSKKKKK
ncbi:WG repeat-containing protein [Maribacter sp. 1_2014MBL_MicDiv]|uniref:WG repeat-containing protein n=1 Tax=Maribacter sp. 1_2014MBL_MicDiv TaxID=1644130 RepID=UPI0008F53E2A|nr:WG repeat-containing protein [Maribacter sp. 1_2014MBL_MicDiv]APA65999.1 hypothetical protein YQ22_17805 [Maribacter sp. 1_2014MBL_MicDiv]